MKRPDLPRELPIDPAYERRVMRALFPSRRWLPLAAAAALLAGFIGGLFVPRRTPPSEPGQQFLLLLHGGTPGHVEEYREWAQSQPVRSGAKLTEDVLLIGHSAQPSRLGGYFRIAAGSRAEAEVIARSCPHLKYGGWIELREIER